MGYYMGRSLLVSTSVLWTAMSRPEMTKFMISWLFKIIGWWRMVSQNTCVYLRSLNLTIRRWGLSRRPGDTGVVAVLYVREQAMRSPSRRPAPR